MKHFDLPSRRPPCLPPGSLSFPRLHEPRVKVAWHTAARPAASKSIAASAIRSEKAERTDKVKTDKVKMVKSLKSHFSLTA